MNARVVAEGKYLRLVERDGWEYVDRKKASGVVAIVAITADRRLILTEQRRVAVDRFVIDLPAGLAGDTDGAEGEALSEAARRELIEEVGYDAEEMRELETTPASPGLSTELVTFFSAERPRKVGDGGGVEGEGITVHEVPLAELDRFFAGAKARGALIDAKLYAGLRMCGC